MDKENIAGCIFQVKFGNEQPCCKWKWGLVCNEKSSNEHKKRMLNGNIQAGKAPTACIPGSLGSACQEGIKEYQERQIRITNIIITSKR